MRHFLSRGHRRAFGAVGPEINFLLPLITAGACRPDARLSILQAGLLNTSIDASGLKIAAVRVAQIWRAVIARAAGDLDINETKNWICATVFFESVASALAGLLRTIERVENGAVHLRYQMNDLPDPR
jgi:hypothetical protein